jgi:TPR repeat protein
MSTKKAKEPRPSKKPAPQLEAGRAAYMAGEFDKAREIWLPLAEAGDAEAQAWIGSLYANGDGVEVDDSAAFAWYLKSAEAGNVLAQSNVGAMYAMGTGVAQDDKEAVRWFERAAENGDAHGQFNLAVLLTSGTGISKDLAKAAEWYRAAAEGGHYPSQARLGQMYATGHGVEKDRVQAYLWLSLAAQHGIGTALNALEGVVKHMSSEEKSEALNLFDMWRGKTAASAGPSRIEPLPG